MHLQNTRGDGQGLEHPIPNGGTQRKKEVTGSKSIQNLVRQMPSALRGEDPAPRVLGSPTSKAQSGTSRGSGSTLCHPGCSPLSPEFPEGPFFPCLEEWHTFSTK